MYEGMRERFEWVLSIYHIHNKKNENKKDNGVSFFNYQISSNQKFDNFYVNKNTGKQLVINSGRNINLWNV